MKTIEVNSLPEMTDFTSIMDCPVNIRAFCHHPRGLQAIIGWSIIPLRMSVGLVIMAENA